MQFAVGSCKSLASITPNKPELDGRYLTLCWPLDLPPKLWSEGGNCAIIVVRPASERASRQQVVGQLRAARASDSTNDDCNYFLFGLVCKERWSRAVCFCVRSTAIPIVCMLPICQQQLVLLPLSHIRPILIEISRLVQCSEAAIFRSILRLASIDPTAYCCCCCFLLFRIPPAELEHPHLSLST